MSSDTLVIKTPCITDSSVSYTPKKYSIQAFKDRTTTSDDDVERICKSHGLNRQGLGKDRSSIATKLAALTVDATTKPWLDKISADLGLPVQKAATRTVVLNNLLASKAWKNALKNVSNLSRTVAAPPPQNMVWTRSQAQRAQSDQAATVQTTPPRRMDWSYDSTATPNLPGAMGDLAAILQRSLGRPHDEPSNPRPSHSTSLAPISRSSGSQSSTNVSELSGLLVDLAVGEEPPTAAYPSIVSIATSEIAAPSSANHVTSVANISQATEQSDFAINGSTISSLDRHSPSHNDDSQLVDELARLKLEIQQLRSASKSTDVVLFNYNQDLLKAAESRQQQDEIISKQAARIAELETKHTANEHDLLPYTPQNSILDRSQQPVVPLHHHFSQHDILPTSAVSPASAHHVSQAHYMVEGAELCSDSWRDIAYTPADLVNMTLLNFADAQSNINRAHDETLTTIETAAEKTVWLRMASKQLKDALTHEARKIDDYESQMRARLQSPIDDLLG